MTVGRTPSGSAGGTGRRKATRVPRTRGGTLGAPRLPRVSLQSRGWRIGLIAAALLLVTGWFTWYATTPEDLPTSGRTVSASGVAGTPLYVGMFAAPDGFGRTLRIAGVKVHATTSAEIEVTPMLCRRGTVGVTTRPEQFCADLVDTEGARMVGGDSVVLRIESADSALAVIDQIKVAFREDVRWDTLPAGHEQAIITMAGRPAPEDPAP